MKKYILVISVLVIGIATAWSFLFTPQNFALQEVNVVVDSKLGQGLTPFYQNKIEQQLKDYKGRSLLSLSLGELRDDINKNEFVHDVEIERRFPRDLIVKVTPHEALLGVMSKKGISQILTNNGTLVAGVPLMITPDLPLTFSQKKLDDPEIRNKVAALFKHFPESPHLHQKNISEVTLEKETILLALRDPEVEIISGYELSPVQVSRIERVLEYLDQHQLKGRVIDATFSKKVLVRLRKAP